MSVLGTSRSLDGRGDSVKPFPVATPLCYDGRGNSPCDDCDRGTPLFGLWATLTAEIENDGGRRLPGRSRPARLGRFEKHGRDRECRSVSLLPDDSHFVGSEEYSAHEFLSFYLRILLPAGKALLRPTREWSPVFFLPLLPHTCRTLAFLSPELLL
jgi:hypothetical protein